MGGNDGSSMAPSLIPSLIPSLTPSFPHSLIPSLRQPYVESCSVTAPYPWHAPSTLKGRLCKLQSKITQSVAHESLPPSLSVTLHTLQGYTRGPERRAHRRRGVTVCASTKFFSKACDEMSGACRPWLWTILAALSTIVTTGLNREIPMVNPAARPVFGPIYGEGGGERARLTREFPCGHACGILQR